MDTTGYVTRRQTTLMYRKRSSGGSGKLTHSDAVDLSAEPDLEVRLSIDGRWVATHVVGAAAGDRVTTFRGAAVSDALLRRFRFVKVSCEARGDDAGKSVNADGGERCRRVNVGARMHNSSPETVTIQLTIPRSPARPSPTPPAPAPTPLPSRATSAPSRSRSTVSDAAKRRARGSRES